MSDEPDIDNTICTWRDGDTDAGVIFNATIEMLALELFRQGMIARRTAQLGSWFDVGHEERERWRRIAAGLEVFPPPP